MAGARRRWILHGGRRFFRRSAGPGDKRGSGGEPKFRSSQCRGLCERIDVGIGAVAGWSLTDLARLPASKAFVYATACLEREAIELSRQIELFLTPAEAFGGRYEVRKHLQQTVRSLLGGHELADTDPRELEAIAEIERELAEQYPWYADPERLNRVWRDHGKLGRQMFPV